MNIRTDIDKNKIKELYLNGMSIRKIQDELKEKNVSYKCIYKVLVDENILRKKENIHKVNRKELYYFYQNGYKIPQLAQMYNITEKKAKEYINQYEERIAYLNKKYGEGKWVILDKAQLMELFKRDMFKSSNNDDF